MMQKAPIILASGGTGGHMMPAEAVAGALKALGQSTLLVTDTRGKAIGNAFQGQDSFVLTATSHMAGGVLGKVRAVFSILDSTIKVRAMFKRIKPAMVIGFGGYPSMPAVLAARSLGIPYALHEQNAVLGRVNRFAAKKAAFVALSVEDTARVPDGAHTVVVGNPVRPVIKKVANTAYSVPLGDGALNVFVIGGSQGARILSDVVPDALKAFPAGYIGRLKVTHQARPEDLERVKAAYAHAGIEARVESYFDDVAGVLLGTQLVICRAGASTLAELAAMGRPAIFVPLAIAADDHQAANAERAVAAGGGWVLKEATFKPDALKQLLQKLFDDTGALRAASDAMRTLARLDAAENIAQHTLETLASTAGKN